MAHILYSLEPSGEQNSVVFRRLWEVSLEGFDGPIGKFARNRANIEDPRWHMPETDLLRYWSGSPETHAFVIDLKPKTRRNVSLARLRDVWGYSKYGWTPMLWRLEILWIDRDEEHPPIFKGQFDDADAVHDEVFEFLYMLEKSRGGHWRFGAVGRVNGTLLWPEALEYFVDVLRNRGN